MELLYLWIEQYNNIKKQGFTFSNKYDIHFKNENENNKIEIEKKSNPVQKNFFGKNIRNVTAIIGENGVGKTSIIDFIAELHSGWTIYDENILKNKEFIAVFKTKEEKIMGIYYLGDNLILSSDSIELIKTTPYDARNEDDTENKMKYITRKIQEKLTEKFKSIVYSHTIETGYRSSSTINNTDFINITTNYLLKKNNGKDKIGEYEKKEKLKEVKFIVDNYKDFKQFKLPESLIINLNANLLLNTYQLHKKEEKELRNLTELLTKVDNYVKSNISNVNKENEKYKIYLLQLILCVYIAKYTSRENSGNLYMPAFSLIFNEGCFIEKSNAIDSIMTLFDVFIKEYKEVEIRFIKLEEIRKNYGNDYSQFKDKLTPDEKESIKNCEFKIANSNDFWFALNEKLTILNRIKELEKIKEFIDFLLKKIDESYIDIGYFRFKLSEEDGSLNYFDLKEFFEKYYDVFPDNYENPIFEYQYNRVLSTGQQKILSLFSRLYYIKIEEKLKTENLYIILDEPDIYFHPEWQRIFFKEFMNFVDDLFKNISNIQIILTSHSPFVISDLPKECIVFLGNDENEFCKVIFQENMKNTFGANIFDLYSGAFFVKSSFGEFAKNKIQDVVKKIEEKKYDENKDEIDFIVSSIGEPLIRNKLLNMIKENKSKEDRIMELEKELEKLRGGNE